VNGLWVLRPGHLHKVELEVYEYVSDVSASARDEYLRSWGKKRGRQWSNVSGDEGGRPNEAVESCANSIV